MTYQTPRPLACPYCGKLNELHSGVSFDGSPERGPKGGDASFCIGCGMFAIYVAPMSLRKPTAREGLEIETDPRFAVVVKAWRDGRALDLT